MKANVRALTIVELFFIIVVVIVVLAALLLPYLARQRETARFRSCAANLREIGKAMAAYREDNSGYFPFSWQKAGDPGPVGTGAVNGAMAATSLGNLYPRYVQNAKWFKCPSTEDAPSFVLNLPMEYRNPDATAQFRWMLPKESNWTLKTNGDRDGASYGYDPRMSPRAAAKSAVMADMDGSWDMTGMDTMNHGGGQNVLYVDGHVTWQGTNFCSTDPNDNIFAEDAWDADTDTYLLSKDTGLGISFDGYKHLHYPQK